MEYCHATDTVGDSNAHSSSNLTDDDTPNTIRAQVGRGGREIVMQDGKMTMTHDAPQEFNTGTGFVREGDLLSTARSPSGSAVFGREVRDTDLVSIQGMECTVAVAKGLGLISQGTVTDANGNVSSRLAATAEGNAMMTPAAEEEDGITLSDGSKLTMESAEAFVADEDTEQLMSDLVGSTAPDTQIAAINSFIRDGDVDPKVIDRLASQAGLEPEEAGEMFTQIVEGMGEALVHHLEAFGVHDDEAFGDFLDSDPQLQQARDEALRNLMMSNSTAGWEQLAGQFREQVAYFDPNGTIDALEAAGWAWEYSDEGHMMVETRQNGWLPFETAVKAGLLTFS